MDKILSKCNPEKHHRRSIRLKEYDYSTPGAYFVTICVNDNRCLFGKVKSGKVVLSRVGKFVYQCWREIPYHFDSVKLVIFAIMPNHFHSILFLDVGARFIVPKMGFDKSNPYIKNNPMVLTQPTLGKIIISFKAKTTHQIRKYTKFNNFQWQRNYYEHIIRNEEKLNLIREYIL
jgi:putative transposase